MIRALRDPRWLSGLAVAVVFALVCVWLAQWQLDRRVARAERNAAVLENYDSPPVALAVAVPDLGADLPVAAQWRPVTLQGRYDQDGTVLVRNRPQGGSNGYLVATPFLVNGGAAGSGTTGSGTAGSGVTTSVLLVRGWLPSGADASSPGAVPDAPTGRVDVVARLRSDEEPSGRSAPQGQAYRLDVADLLADAPGDVVAAAYGVVASEEGTTPPGLVPVPRPDTDPGPHLAYGVQWYLFALAGLGIWVVLARRHAGEQDDGPGTDDEEDRPGRGAEPERSRAWVYEPGR